MSALKDPRRMSPAMVQFRQNQAKLAALNTIGGQYLDETGKVRNKNSRFRSGLITMMRSLADMFDPRRGLSRDWADFGARLIYGGAGGATGWIRANTDETQDIAREKARLEQENDALLGTAEREWKMTREQELIRQGDTRIANTKTDRDRDFDFRKGKFEYDKLQDNQKQVLQILALQKRYRPGENPDLDAKMASAGIIVKAFDHTKKDIVENGVRKSWDGEKYVQTPGTEEDPDDRPITYSIDGREVTSSVRSFVGYAGAKERQNTSYQQQVNLTQLRNDLGKEGDYDKAAQFVREKVTSGKAAINEGKLSRDKYLETMNYIIDSYPEPIRSKLKAAFPLQ